MKMIASYGDHIVIKNEKNEIYVCGNNKYGQLGLGDYEDRNKFEKVDCDFGKIKNIACGGNHMIIQNEKNEIYVCGSNHYGQLCLGNKCQTNKFEKVEHEFGEIKNTAYSCDHTIIQNKKNSMWYVSYSNSK